MRCTKTRTVRLSLIWSMYWDSQSQRKRERYSISSYMYISKGKGRFRLKLAGLSKLKVYCIKDVQDFLFSFIYNFICFFIITTLKKHIKVNKVFR